MARRKRQNPMLNIAQQYLDVYIPELRGAELHLRYLDGPAGSPRYSVTAEKCLAGSCPYDVPPAAAAVGQCPIRDCELRCCVRMLLDRGGGVVQATRCGVHWN
jgi:hypothetical protein